MRVENNKFRHRLNVCLSASNWYFHCGLKLTRKRKNNTAKKPRELKNLHANNFLIFFVIYPSGDEFFVHVEQCRPSRFFFILPNMPRCNFIKASTQHYWPNCRKPSQVMFHSTLWQPPPTLCTKNAGHLETMPRMQSRRWGRAKIMQIFSCAGREHMRRSNFPNKRLCPKNIKNYLYASSMFGVV